MKFLNIVYSFFFFLFFLSCGSKDSNEQVLENLNITSVSGFSASQETQLVTVTSNLDWTVSTDVNWITTTPSSGTNNGSINISVTANSTENIRKSIVTIAGSTISRDIVITQAGQEPPNLMLSSISEFSSDQETQSVSVTSNLDWSVTDDSSWITTTPSSGTNNGSIDISVTTNSTESARTGTVTVMGGSISKSLTITQAKEVPQGELDPNKAPSENFDLSTWKLNTPEDNGNGLSKTISVSELNNEYENSNYFYTGSDGGMVFKCPVDGKKTSANTSYTRVELREMLRGTNTSISTQGVNKNNWVFGTAPSADKIAAAGFDGEMNATLAVNYVTTTGDDSHIGRLIIGQIHANNDEPIRIYYRKLKNNTLGSIYFAHEPTDGNGDEQWYEMIGYKSSSASNPSDGIALNEKFSYRIKVVGDILTVTITRDGKDDVVKVVNMATSGFNVGGQYMYFKAGVYQGNKSGDADDYAQATFYALEKTHSTN